jgi:diguanylate cyclase (GGDEF)-like protein/PAS domain S-box-containing protein
MSHQKDNQHSHELPSANEIPPPASRQAALEAQYHQLQRQLAAIETELATYQSSLSSSSWQQPRLQAIFQQDVVGIVEIGLDGYCRYANQKFCALIGYSQEQLPNKTIADMTHPHEAVSSQATLSSLLQGEIEQATGEQRLLHQDGRSVWVHVTATPVRHADGTIEAAIAIVEDLTPAKRLEATLVERESALRSFYNSTSMMMGIVEVTEDDIHHIWDNAATAQFFRISPAELKNRHASELRVPTDIQALWQQHYRESQRRQQPVRFEYQHPRNGEMRHLSVTVSPILAEGTKYQRFCYIAEDISDRKQIETSLRQTMQKLLQSQQIAHIGDWEFEVGSQKVTWSEPIFQIFGLDPNQGVPSYEDIVGMIHPEDRDRYRATLERTLCFGDPLSIAFRLIQPNGNIRYLKTRAEIEFDDFGKPARLFGVAIDITDRKEAEEAMKASEQKYRLLVEQMPAAIYRAHLDRNITTTYISPEIEAMLGYSPEQWQQNPNLWVDLLHPDDREEVLVNLHQMQKLGKGFVSEYRLVTSAGKTIWVRDRARVVTDNEGNPLFLQGVMLDITSRKQAELALLQQAKQEQSLSRITQQLHQSLNLEDILETTVEEARQFLCCDRVVVYRLEIEGEGTVIRESVAEACPSILGTTIRDMCLVNASCRVREADRASIVEDREASHIHPCYRALLESINVRATIVLPIFQGQQFWGLLAAQECDRSRQWDPLDVHFLTRLARQVGIATQQSHLYEELKASNRKLKRQAAADGLTGIANRRYFQYYFQREWQRSQREQVPIALILCDIDFFKQYNDTYGHLAGDDCLKQVAKLLEKTIRRPADLAARYGGEEFVILLPNTHRSGAQVIANNLQQNLFQLHVVHKSSPISDRITLSLGVAATIPQPGEASNTLIAEADRCLYAAKEQGRNRTVATTDNPPENH